MKTCRKPIAMVLLLLIPLLTLQIGDAVAGRNVTNARSDPEIILEEVIITGSGNNTRVTANALAGDASKISDEILSLLSKDETRRSRRSKQNLDQDAAQSSTADVNDEDVERLKRVIAKYEPQRITSRKTKRKIVEVPNNTHDVRDKAAVSTTDLERAYAEMLQNISRNVPELVVNNADVASNSYLSQVMKNLKQIYIPNVTIRPATESEAQKSRSDVDTSYTSPLLKSKKTKKSFKKYSPLNRTVTTPRVSSVGESREPDKETVSNESGTPQGYFEVSNGKTKSRNGSLPQSSSNIYLNPTEKLESHHEWNVQDSSSQNVPPFTSRLNNSNHLNVPSNVDAVRLLSKYNVIPRPFSVSQSPNSPIHTSLEISHKKPSVSPAVFNHQPIARSSAHVLPLVLPTDLFNPSPVRRYVPIKRANHLDGSTTTVISTEATSSTSPAGARTIFADYGALYADVIGTTRSPPLVVNGQRSSGLSDYYAITENPVERTVARTNSVYIPSQTSASYTLQRQKDPQTVRKNELLLPRVATYNQSPDNEKSNLNEDPGIALYNKFASLYSANTPSVFNVPKAITQEYQDFKRPTQSSTVVIPQQVTTLPYATLKPTLAALPKVRPIAAAKPALAPYYDSKLLVSQGVDGKLNGDKDNEENVETNERSRTENADKSEEEVADDKSDLRNYKTKINHEAYKIHKAPNKEREKEDGEEDEKEDGYSQQRRNYGYYQHDNNDGNDKNGDKPEKYENNEEESYPQQKRNYKYQDRHHEYDNDKKNKNDDRSEKHKNLQRENNEDEEDTDETQGDEYVSTGKSEDEDNHDRYNQYNKYGYDRDSEEEERDKQRYDRKKYDGPKNYYGKHDREADVKQRLESNNKYSVSRYNDDDIRGYNKEHRDRYAQDVSTGDKKNRKDRKHEDSDDESVAEDKLFAERFKDPPRQREKYEKKQNKDNDTIYKHKYHRHQAAPRKDHEEHKREEYSETNPKHVREEYQQRVKGDHREHDSGDQNDGEGEASDHVHGETQEHAHKHEEHHEKKKDGGNHKFEEGGGSEHHKDHHGHEGEKGDKGYKVWHEHEKGEKGHHDKEHASKEYDEKDGEEKKHEEEGGYHEAHHQDEAGKKTAEFGEKGEHKKGHSTHGEHSVHKKDEYEKKTEFFDEFHEDGGAEKHGEHHHGHESKKGGHEKKGHHDEADHEEKYGKEEKHEKGGHHHEHKGHKVDEGHDHHYDHDEKHGKKEGHEHGKKWSYKKGDGGHKHNR